MNAKSPSKPGGEFLEHDLFGDPVPAHWCKKGRPPHVATAENRQKVLVGLAIGWSIERIANGLRVTKATLKKHYSIELKQAEQARDALVLAQRHALVKRALAGNDAGAIKQLGQLIERHGLDALGAPAPAPTKPEGPKLPAPWRQQDLGGDVAGTA